MLMPYPIIIHHCETIDSTQKEARRRLPQCNAGEYTVFSADSQTDGIGTHGKKWHSPAGKNISLTLVFFLPEEHTQLPNGAQVASLSIAQSLQQELPQLRLKWPNDLMVSNKKIGGILVEVVATSPGYAVLVGVGLNVNAEANDLSEAQTPATSLLLETGKVHDREQLRSTFVSVLIESLNRLIKKGFLPFKDDYERLLIWQKGDTVSLDTPTGTKRGLYQGIDDDGKPLLG